MKTCAGCKTPKHRSEFNTDKHSKDGTSRLCKRCHIIAARNHRRRRNRAAAALQQACLDFVQKVDRGEARSVRSYAQMREALALAKPFRFR